MSIEASKVIGQTQRNWDQDYVIPDNELQHLLEVCLNSPVKQSRNAYSVLISTNKKFNDVVYDSAHDGTGVRFFGKQIEEMNQSHKDKLRNGQVTAPVLIMFNIHRLEESDNKKDINYPPDFYFSAGVSAGATALEAAQLGYKTGFCSCIDAREFLELLKDKYTDNEELINFWTKYKINDILCLGIGKEDPNFGRNDVVKDGKKLFTVSPAPTKEITTFILK